MGMAASRGFSNRDFTSRANVDSAQLLAEANELMPDVLQLRRAIHTEPEIGLDLPLTQAKVVNALADLDLTIETGTVNDDDFAAFSIDVLSDLIGPANVTTMPAPVMGAEDWSYVLQEVPGIMAFLGVCPDGQQPRQAHACHSNRMRVDEDAMAVGIAAHAAIALSYLGY